MRSLLLFDTAEIPWWAWVRRFHLPEVRSAGSPVNICVLKLAAHVKLFLWTVQSAGRRCGIRGATDWALATLWKRLGIRSMLRPVML